jgi:hypothetical protein
MTWTRTILSCALAWMLVISAAPPMAAYDYPLSSTAIRDASLRATEPNSGTPDFLAAYTRNFSARDNGPYISSIAVVTPYLQVYRRATQGLGYSSQDAVQEFLGKPMSLKIEVTIQGLSSGGPLMTGQGLAEQVPEIWHDYKITLSQERSAIRPVSTTATALASNYTASPTGVAIVGIVIVLQYDPHEVESAPVKIQVAGPDGSKTKAKFDLSRLR